MKGQSWGGQARGSLQGSQLGAALGEQNATRGRKMLGLMRRHDLQSRGPLWLEIATRSTSPGELSGGVSHWNDDSLGPG